MADKTFMAELLINTGLTGLTACGLSAAVGYNHKAGKSEDEYMPHLGPIPADLGVAGLGLLGAVAAMTAMKGQNGRYAASAAMGVASGGLASFMMSVGQSAGESLYDQMNGSAGIPARAAGQVREFRDANGRYVAGEEWAQQRSAVG